MQYKILRKATSKEESLLQKKILPKATNEKKISKKTDILGRPAKYFWTVIRIYDSCFLQSKKQES